MQNFLQFHLIENFGCDFASTGLQKKPLETKLKAFFQKKSNDGSFYNTYMLYYCGPTSALTDGFTFVDGEELTIDQIIDSWKQIHCCDPLKEEEEEDDENAGNVNQNLNRNETDDSDNSNNPNREETQLPPIQPKRLLKKEPTLLANNSRLIIVLDAENTAKSLQYVKTKLRESNVYVALQTVKYNFNSNPSGQVKKTKSSTSKIVSGIENKLILGQKLSSASSKQKKSTLMGPGSPQTISHSFFDSYLNIGKFTLDWIKSNCNAAYHLSMPNGGAAGGGVGGEMESLNQTENFLGLGSLVNNVEFKELDEEDEEFRGGGEDEEDEEDDDDD
jgi:hypothetical protein